MCFSKNHDSSHPICLFIASHLPAYRQKDKSIVQVIPCTFLSKYHSSSSLKKPVINQSITIAFDLIILLLIILLKLGEMDTLDNNERPLCLKIGAHDT